MFGQISLLDGGNPLKIDKPIRLIELFAGIGAQAKALENLGVPFEHYRICEFDKYAVKSYNAVHGTNFETSDVTKIHAEDLGVVDTDKYCYILTYSFPCTDLSKAGKQAGMSRESGTRSGLLWEVERLLKEMTELPQILLMENVPDMVSPKFIGDFAEWVAFLDGLGYTSKWDILNAKNYGIPQNRERCFMVSWLGDFYYDFPDPIPLKLRLKDMLEDSVDEKYYLPDAKVSELLRSQSVMGKMKKALAEPICVNSKDSDGKQPSLHNRIYDSDGIATACTTAPFFMPSYKIEEPQALRIVRTEEGKRLRKQYEAHEIECGFNEHRTAEPREDGCSNTLSTVQKDNYIAIPQATKQGYIEREIGGVVDLSYPNSKTRRGRVQEGGSVSPTVTAESMGLCRLEPVCVRQVGRDPENPTARKVGTPTQQMVEPYQEDGCVGSLTTVQKDNMVMEPSIRIRKLTPRECWRLMGFDDGSFERAEKVNSNSQLYKQAGNSIVVDVLMAIFREML